MVTDRMAKAGMLNNEFSSVFTKENTSNLPEKADHLFPLCLISISRLQAYANLLSNLNPSKAAGPNEIPARVLKYTANSISRFYHVYSNNL